MSLADVALICQAYIIFKETYKRLRENEEAMRDVLEEIFLYEELIAMYSSKITMDTHSSQSAFVMPIRKFASGVEGFRLLFSEYSNHKGPIAKAWNCCSVWCCTQKNSARIKNFTEELAKAVALLGFSAEVLIVRKVDQLRLQQTEMQSKLCDLLDQVKLGNTQSTDIGVVKELVDRLGTTESAVIGEIRESRAEIQAIRSEIYMLRQEMLAVKDDTQALRRSMQEMCNKVGSVSDKMSVMRSRLDDVHEVMRQLADRLEIGGPCCGAAPRAGHSNEICGAHWITAADAREFWTGYFPCEDEVPWARFSPAMRDAFPDLATLAALELIRARIDCDGDGLIHARELNIFSRRLGLRDSIRAAAAAAGVEDADGRTALYRAARGNDLAGVRELLALGADANHVQTFCHTTPLHAAAYYGFGEVARALLEAKARWDIRNEFGSTALQEAPRSPAVLALIRSFIRPASARSLMLKLDQPLLQTPPPLPLPPPLLLSPSPLPPSPLPLPPSPPSQPPHLQSAPGCYPPKYVGAAGGSAMDSEDAAGTTALYRAANCGYDDSEAVLLLLDRRANVNHVQLKRGATALHAATYRGHNRVVTALLEARAQPELLDAYGRRAMEYALDRCSMLVIEMLLDYSK